MSFTVVCPYVPQFSAVHCVALNKIDLKYIVSMMPFDVLHLYFSTRPGLFLSG